MKKTVAAMPIVYVLVIWLKKWKSTLNLLYSIYIMIIIGSEESEIW